MEPMKRCPQCGKSISADRTYCMSCGTTVGVRCTDCQAISPVGSRICAACGRSFIEKKQFSELPIRKAMKKYAPVIILALASLILILTFVAAGNPTVFVGHTVDGEPRLPHSVTGYELIGHFLSGDPASVTTLLELPEMSDVRPALQALLYGAGAGWILLLAGAALAICLSACNLTRMGRSTGRRLFLPLSIAAAGSLLIFLFGKILAAILTDRLEVKASATAQIEWNTTAAFPLFMLILTLLVIGVQALLYIDTFRHLVREHELSLSRIFYIPLALAARGVRSLIRSIRYRKYRQKNKSAHEEEEPGFSVTHRFTSYLILFGVALIFTQALLSKVSNIFFWFIFFLPLVMLLYVFLAARSLAVEMRSRTTTTEKNTPYNYNFRIQNRSILAIPFLEAMISIPQSNSVRCTERLVRLSMAPMTGYTLNNTVTFRFRGTYEIGVRCFYVYDFFRLFRVRVDMEDMTTVYVMPRKLTPDDVLAQAISDSTVRTVRSPLVVDKLEVSDIRDYQNGDPLKSIHWKLSSKSEEFVVKDYNTGTANQTVIYCDMAPHFPDEPPAMNLHGSETNEEDRTAQRSTAAERPSTSRSAANRQVRKSSRIQENQDTHAISEEELDARLRSRATAAKMLSGQAPAARAVSKITGAETEEVTVPRTPVNVHELSLPTYYEDMNEYLADGVVELTIAMVFSELRQGHEVLLVWFDRRSDSGICAYPLRGIDEFEAVYHLFATAPLCDLSRKSPAGNYDVTSLSAMAGHLQNAKQLFVIPTLDGDMLSSLSALPGAADAGNAGSTEVVLYSPEERFKHPAERSAYLEGCREQLAAHGISLTAGAFNINTLNISVESTAEGGEPHEA